MWTLIRSFLSKYKLQLILLLALTNGLIYLFLVPPWQHYDEPGHFEYSWLAANQDHWPETGEYVQSLRREVAASMIEHGFFKGLDYKSNLLSIEEPIFIGISQTDDLPVYYFIASLPLRLIEYTDVTFQLYVVRFLSLLFFLLTVWLGFQSSRLVFGQDHPLTWMVPMFLALLPGFTDLMTAANNDVAAIAFTSLFVFSSILIFKYNFSIKSLLLLTLSTCLCLFTKSTAFLVLPMFVIVIILGLTRKIAVKIKAIFVITLALVVVLLVFSWEQQSPAYFYANSDQQLPKRTLVTNTPVGEYAIVQENQKYSNQSFFLAIDEKGINREFENSMTLGFWAWADLPAEITFPILKINNTNNFLSDGKLSLTTEPTFYSFPVTIPSPVSLAWIQIYPTTNTGNQSYWDGLFLVDGDFSTSVEVPQYLDAKAEKIQWRAVELTNFIKNGSGETGWPIFSNIAGNLFENKIRISTSSFWSFLDYRSNGWYLRTTLNHIIQSFWAVFGWSHIYLTGENPYLVFKILLILSTMGWLARIFTKKKEVISPIILFFLVFFGTQLAIVLLRGAGTWFSQLLVPAARYFFPAILPTVILIVGGWYFGFRPMFDKIRIPGWTQAVLYFLVLISIDVWSILTIYRFYL